MITSMKSTHGSVPFTQCGSIGLDECNGKLMEGLKTLKACGKNSDFSSKMMKMCYSLVVRQVQ